jgi:hypothetical protein
MGYGVYNDGHRWAGYGVPAVCDWDTCMEEIDRGLYFKCEEHGEYEVTETRDPETEELIDVDEKWLDNEGCGYFFCPTHLYETEAHEAHSVEKPDSPEWEIHMLTDESWEQWRTLNPEQVESMKARVGD